MWDCSLTALVALAVTDGAHSGSGTHAARSLAVISTVGNPER